MTLFCAETVLAVAGDPLWVVPARDSVELNVMALTEIPQLCSVKFPTCV